MSQRVEGYQHSALSGAGFTYTTSKPWLLVYVETATHSNSSWAEINKTANVSDAEITSRLKSTALYHTLCTILPRSKREHMPNGFESSPDVALAVPSLSDIAARWSGLPSDDVEDIMEDYCLERDQLGELELEDVYVRVRELASQDSAWQ